MSTRVHFIGGPLDGQALRFVHRPPSLYVHTSPQEDLLNPPAVVEPFEYEKVLFMDTDGTATYVYLPLGKQATAVAAMLEQRIKES